MNYIINDQNQLKLKKIAEYMLNKIHDKDEELYEEIVEDLYLMEYGCHFNSLSLEEALEKLKNEDGTTGAHWSLEDTNSVAKSYDIKFDTFNEYDFNYVMNMIYSDYYGYVDDNVKTYVNLAKAFLMDKDNNGGKAYRYYCKVAN